MQIHLYTYQAERNRIAKNDYLTNHFSIYANIENLTPSSIVKILVNKINSRDIHKYNYMYIEDFGLYYFIDDILTVNANTWIICAHIDDMNYKNYVEGKKCFTN